MSSPASGTTRRPRRDALRNDAIIIDAARAVFAEQGPQASMESIAARAGLGVGTIYRRFAGKEDLLDAIARLFVEEMDAAAADALADPDPARGLDRFIDFVGAFNAEKRRYATALTERVTSEEVSRRIMEKVERLTRRAVEAGVLAPGTTGRDVEALIVAIRAVVGATAESEPDAWRRFARIHLAGLRAGAPETDR